MRLSDLPLIMGKPTNVLFVCWLLCVLTRFEGIHLSIKCLP